MKIFPFVKEIIRNSPRQFEGETETLRMIMKRCREHRVPCIAEHFDLRLPHFSFWELQADGRTIPSLPSCLVGGTISSKDNVVSSMSNETIQCANINFNPYCRAISRPMFYEVPALSVAPADIIRIVRARTVHGFVRMERKIHTSANLLVGNSKNPNAIIFAHYDSIETGALDNASGVAVVLHTALTRPKLLEDHLFVFSGCEELSFEHPYWGFGFRMFEKKHVALMAKAAQIIVVDGVGNEYARWYGRKEPEIIALGFPLRNMQKFLKKTIMLSSTIAGYLPTYHSILDDGTNIREMFLQRSHRSLLKKL